MHVGVVGCGLLGLTTAHYLREFGCEVTVFDRTGGPAQETSYANGSMITPSLADPWNSPGVFGALLKSLGKEDSAMLLRAKAIPSLVGWGLRFLHNATEARFREGFLANARFAKYSQDVMQNLLQAKPMDFEYAPDGVIKVFPDAASLAAARATSEWLREEAGVAFRTLDQAALLDLEPALADAIDRLHGGIYFPEEEVGNARLFCEALLQYCINAGVTFRFNETVVDMEVDAKRVRALVTDRETIELDAVVLAGGSFSWPLAKKVGINVPVRPAKGYSITLPMVELDPKPRHAVVDEHLHAAVVPLGGQRFRVAGTAEFTGFDDTVNPARIENLKVLLKMVYPQVSCRDDQVEGWCGFRPMTPDGKPIIGSTKVQRLYLCTGHGPLGWTLACGSGKSLAELMVGKDPEYDISGFAFGRY